MLSDGSVAGDAAVPTVPLTRRHVDADGAGDEDDRQDEEGVFDLCEFAHGDQGRRQEETDSEAFEGVHVWRCLTSMSTRA